MPRDLILGTAGHIDHGKTSLVKALTGIDCDRLPEEKARGITIDIGFATLDLGNYRLGIVDVPGHERFIKNMLAGATGVDLAVLVIAADDSIMPQTRAHLGAHGRGHCAAQGSHCCRLCPCRGENGSRMVPHGNRPLLYRPGTWDR